MRRIMTGLLLLCGALAAKANVTAVEGVNEADSVMVLGKMVHRAALEPVESGAKPITYAIDTLPSKVSGVNVVLFNDNSWKYVKSDAYIEDQKLFSENWSDSVVNPYMAPIDSIPEVWSLWLVDSLSGYHCPTTGRVTSKFGIRHGRRHQGTDLSQVTGTPLYNCFDGKVRISSYKQGYGNLVVVRHNNGMETFYGHLSRRDVKSGDIVRAGDIIGLSGNTGRSTGPHLHFETRYQGLAFDPQRIMDFENGNLKQRMMVLKRRYFESASRYDQNFDEEFLLQEDDAKALAEQKRKQEEEARKAITYHTVRSGDCLSRIAAKYHTTVGAICRLNKGMTPNSTIQIGRRIRVR